jgi:hypothetical protein
MTDILKAEASWKLGLAEQRLTKITVDAKQLMAAVKMVVAFAYPPGSKEKRIKFVDFTVKESSLFVDDPDCQGQSQIDAIVVRGLPVAKFRLNASHFLPYLKRVKSCTSIYYFNDHESPVVFVAEQRSKSGARSKYWFLVMQAKDQPEVVFLVDANGQTLELPITTINQPKENHGKTKEDKANESSSEGLGRARAESVGKR